MRRALASRTNPPRTRPSRFSLRERRLQLLDAPRETRRNRATPLADDASADEVSRARSLRRLRSLRGGGAEGNRLVAQTRERESSRYPRARVSGPRGAARVDRAPSPRGAGLRGRVVPNGGAARRGAKGAPLAIARVRDARWAEHRDRAGAVDVLREFLLRERRSRGAPWRPRGRWVCFSTRRCATRVARSSTRRRSGRSASRRSRVGRRLTSPPRRRAASALSTVLRSRRRRPPWPSPETLGAAAAKAFSAAASPRASSRGGDGAATAQPPREPQQGRQTLFATLGGSRPETPLFRHRSLRALR